MIDLVYPCHKKDIITLKLAIRYARKNIKDLNNIYVISKDKLIDDAIWIKEDDYPFSYKDICDIIGNHNRTGWYYQQLLKLNVHKCKNISLNENFIISCADNLFISPVSFLENDKSLFNLSPNDGTPYYFEFLNKLIPGFKKQLTQTWSGTVHHTVVKKKILQHMTDTVEKIHKVPFWKAFLLTIKQKYNCENKFLGNETIKDGPGRSSDYDTYVNYALQYFPKMVKIRMLKSVLAYKGHLNVKGENFTKTHVSRTNLSLYNNRIQIIPPNIELENEFETLEDALEFHISACQKMGFVQVTFQNHTRQGSNNVTGNAHGDKR